MKTTDWVIVDTETDGLMDPIHVVEIAAQRMRGWEPVGEKFRVLLNHNVPIPSVAVAIHGYTQEFLRENGEDPLQAHARFRDFAGHLPLVAHNLSFDWNRALQPEWLRLGLPPTGQRGFCSLMLSRRVVDETKSYSLDSLRRTFGITSNFAHRAFADVDSLAALFGQVFRVRLETAGISTFPDLVEFSARTPVAKCLSKVRGKACGCGPGAPTGSADSWYFIDAQNQTHGPLPAGQVVTVTAGVPCWVWREGMSDWISSQKSEEFLQAVRAPSAALPTASPKKRADRSVQDLVDICSAILADGMVTSEEVVFLAHWLEEAGVITEWPWTEIADALERIMADGVVTDSERSELHALLQRVNAKDQSQEKRPKGRRTRTPKSAPVHHPAAPNELKMTCECGQRIQLDANNSQQELTCPACGKQMRAPGREQGSIPAPGSLRPEAPPAQCTTAKLELTCVGNAGGGQINTKIRLFWFEVLVNEDQKRVQVVEHHVALKSHRREKRINICEYEVPEGVVCFYERHVQTKPKLYEQKFFKLENGQFQDLGDGAQSDFYTKFLAAYEGYQICSGSSAEGLNESRVIGKEPNQHGPAICADTVATVSRGSAPTRDQTIAPPSLEVLHAHPQPFTVIQLAQGTTEWLTWRSGGIGASDAPAILGENPWKTRKELFEQKIGITPPEEVNYAMARGTALEPEARQAYNSRTGRWMQPACLQSNVYQWLRASVDGITPTLDALVEIKCGQSVYRNTSESGQVPGYYYAQLQHMLAVTSLPAIDFWCYLPGRPALLISVQRDDRYIARLLQQEYEFWLAVLRHRGPREF